MADVITRFKLETTQYDSKLRDAAKGLQGYVNQVELGGKSFTGFSQKAVEAARALGTTASGATNAKDKVRDLVGSFNDAAKAYNKLSDAQRQSDFGRAMTASLEQLQQRIREAKQELYGLTDAVEKAGKGGGLFGGAKNMMGAIGISPTMLTGIGAATAAFGALKGAIEGNISTAFNFERSMSQLSSLTGKTGKDLETLKEYAIELGSTTTLTASQVADAFRLIGSQQPQLLESSEALKAVTKNAITLSEAAGIDLSTAAQTLSTSINQFGGDSTRATEFINILAAASQKGAGDIGWLGDAITKSGTTAKAVGTDYNELVANLEMLAKAGYDASTAGTALRSIIMSLEKQSNDNFKPSVVGLTQAFKNLQDAQLTLTDYQNTAGKMFAAQAKALAENADEAFRLKDAITGTNIAEEQAATNTANLDGSLKSLSSAWEGLNLHINSSNGFLKEAVDWLKQVVTWADQAFTAAGRAQKKLAEMQGGGNGQPTKVDRQISALGGSNFKPQAFNAQMGRYNQDIKVAEYFLNKFNENHSSVNTVLMEASKRFGQKLNSISDLEAVRDAMVRMRDEYQSRAKTLMQSVTSSVTGTTGINEKPGINIEVDADTDGATKSIKELQAEVKKLTKLRDEAANAGDTKLRDQYNAQIKQTRQQIKVMQGTNTTSHTATPAQRAAENIKAAEQEYSRALEKAALEVQGGTITEAQQKQKQLQATEALWSAYGKASDTVNGTNADYKSRQEQLGQEIVKLGGEVKTATEAQKAAEKSARELEQAQKKLADAQRELAAAQQSGNLKDVYKAQEKVTSAQTDVNRLQKEITQVVNVVPGKVELPQIPKTAKPIEVPITTANIDAFIGNLKERISQSEVGTDLYNNLTKQLTDATMLGNFLDLAVKNGIDAADLHPQEFWKKIFTDNPGDYIDDDVWKKLGEAMSKGIGENLDVDTAQGKVGKSSKQKRDGVQDISKALSGVSSIVGGLESMGVQMSDDVKNVIGVVQGAMSVIQGIQTVISIFQTSSMTANTVAMGLLTEALWANTFASAVPFFANGGIVPHAANGYYIGGNRFSGDTTPILANAGELVLNRAQQGVLADSLQGNGLGNLNLTATIKGEDIRLALNNNSRRRGKGEYVTTTLMR